MDIWNKLGAICVKKLEQNTLNLKTLSKEHNYCENAIYKICDKINYNKPVHKQATGLLKKLWSLYLKLNALGGVLVLSDYYHNIFTSKLIEIFKKHKIPEINIQNFLNSLITTEQETLFWQEQRDLYKIAASYHNFDSSKKSPEFFQHCEKYQWLNYGYQGPINTVEDFTNRLSKIFSVQVKPKQQLANHEQFLNNISKNRTRLETRLNLNGREKKLFNAARQFSYMKTNRVAIRHYVSFTSDMLFRRIAKKMNISPKLFQFATRDEILNLLLGKKVAMAKIRQRTKYLFETITPKNRKFIYKKAARKKIQTLFIRDKISPTDTLHGQAAFLGQSIGKVKVVFSTKDLHKVQHGDIMVAISTNPDLLPAMYRASAFITDSGGITSHAAIVAREMKKPCITGTKIATKIFKDGDMVEVDANKGIIKKIN